MLLTKNTSLCTKSSDLGDLCKFYKGGWLNLCFSYSGGVSSFVFIWESSGKSSIDYIVISSQDFCVIFLSNLTICPPHIYEGLLTVT
jgi:hypothetical protein